uniref:Poly [ADP-ribose] polymerase n=1 Tax=Echeneis naucrates TaxID=173247 RepID=A0A665UK98_ECHNA
RQRKLGETPEKSQPRKLLNYRIMGFCTTSNVIMSTFHCGQFGFSLLDLHQIERLQNIHLRRGYEVQKKQISDKTGRNSAGEKLLYHGTTQDNCDSIMKTGFNRSFAGQNATAYGDGTYFAVDASYSANTVYSKPAADGSQMMFVARVLTGLYTVGKYGMKAPPAFNSQQPHDRYDSVVDNTQKPSMYVAFHDHQAYPDYLITFK